MGGFGHLGYDPAGFDPVERADPPAWRAWLAAHLRTIALFDGWEVYEEPPEQLAGGRCIVIGPRSPYQSWGAWSEVETHLAVSLLVPRAHGPAMDMIDTGLACLRDALKALAVVDIGQVAQLGILEDVGASNYVVASLDVDLEALGGQTS